MTQHTNHVLALKLDAVGATASLICAVHCALFPLFIIFLAFYGLDFALGPLVETLLISMSVAIGAFTFVHGYIKHHKSFLPLLLFLSGIIIILSAHFILHGHSHGAENGFKFEPGYLLSPVGALMIAAGHIYNRKLTKAVRTDKCC